MILPINTFTIHNFIGFAVTGSLAITFYLVYLGMGRRLLDLLSANFITCATFMCLATFMTDNLVPAGMSSWGWTNGPTASELSYSTLEYHRIGWAFSILLLIAKLHFTLAYCGRQNFLRRHIHWFYLLIFAIIPCIWSNTWFQPRSEPLADTSSWAFAIPWIPQGGWPVLATFLVWVSAEVYMLLLIGRSLKEPRERFDEASRQTKLVFLAFLAQVIFGLMDPVMVLCDYNGISMIPIGATLMGGLLAAALIRSRVICHQIQTQLEMERAAILRGIPQPLMCFDTEYRIHWANDASEISQEFNRASTCFHGESWVSPGSQERQIMELAIHSGIPKRTEITRPDETTWIVHASPVRNERGHVFGVILLATEITKLRQAEEAIRVAHGKILAAREEERCRVARDLHDSVAQSLAALSMRIDSARDIQPRDMLHKALDVCVSQCKQLVNEVRQICHALYPPTLDLMGLVRVLEHTFAGNTHSMPCKICTTERMRRLRFSQGIEIAVYRFAQEAIGNALRHSDAESINVTIAYEKGCLNVCVSDNGKGFDQEDISRYGLGMSSMKSRIEGIGGKLSIISRKGQTRVSASVPCAPGSS